jgi:hypothetical protein
MEENLIFVAQGGDAPLRALGGGFGELSLAEHDNAAALG